MDVLSSQLSFRRSVPFRKLHRPVSVTNRTL